MTKPDATPRAVSRVARCEPSWQVHRLGLRCLDKNHKHENVPIKRVVEAAVAGKTVALVAPMVEDLRRLAKELDECGFSLLVSTTKAGDGKRIRERLGITQEHFALSFGPDEDAIGNWEYARREPDLAAKSYLTLIDCNPELTREALAVPVL